MSRSKTEAAAVLYFSSSTRVTRVKERRRRGERVEGSRAREGDRRERRRGSGFGGGATHLSGIVSPLAAFRRVSL